MLEASTPGTRRALTTFRTTFAADFAFCLATLALGCQGQIVGTSPSSGASSSTAGSPTTSAGGSPTTSTPVDVGNLVGADPQQLPDGVPANARVVPTANWNGGTELPELKA
jgi:hypothetical protein